MMEYKGYKAAVQFDDGAKVLHGEVLGLRDVVTFQAESVSELEKAFHDSVDDYLDFCKERGEEPERPYSGKFLLRLDPSLHRHVDVAAAAAGQSVNAWIAHVLEIASESAIAPPRAELSNAGAVVDRRRGASTMREISFGKREGVSAGSYNRNVRPREGGQFKEPAKGNRNTSADRRKPKTKATKK